MSFLRVPLFTLISYYLLLHLGFCKAYQNCLVAIIKITTVSMGSTLYIYECVRPKVFEKIALWRTGTKASISISDPKFL